MLILLAAPLAVLTIPSAIVQFIEQFEVLCRKNWIRPRESLPITPRDYYPKVSLQVPIYSEPPEIVIETLEALSKIDYPNFEVLVVDNNTKDLNLWRPVREHCQKLGDKFRFFHLDSLPGAKAGALNFALMVAAPDAEIIGVIDADYHAQPDFLKSLIGYFDDPKIGFVQAPHDYRDWENNAYLRMCYYEYKIFFHTTMVAINERDAAMTVGTMCLIRRQALEEAGGWAEWCVTEDSELAIRIHAVGYSSVYLTESYGKGLIPETFEGYKNQRYRWTAGPVQEFKHHFNLLMLWPWKKPSLLTLVQQTHHLNHGLDRVTVGLGFLLIPLGFGVIASMVFHREVVQVPFELWLAATVLLISGVFLNWLLYKVVLGASLKDTIGALIASKALSHTISLASFRAIFKEKMPWNRTDKFKASSRLLRALETTKVELLLGSGIFVFIVFAFLLMPLPGLLLMFLIGMGYKGFDYLSASLVAVLSELSINKDKTKVI
ncbi:MAG: glycosyltransferase [Candidatus Woykebacteria bacterium]